MYSEINNLAQNFSFACDEYVYLFLLTILLICLHYSRSSMHIYQFEFNPAAWSQESYEVSQKIYNVRSLYYSKSAN